MAMSLRSIVSGEVQRLERDDYGKRRVIFVIGETYVGQFTLAVPTSETDTSAAIVAAKSRLRDLGAGMADFFERFPQ